ncbi:unnamed protein product, partial [Brassica oleracea]
RSKVVCSLSYSLVRPCTISPTKKKPHSSHGKDAHRERKKPDLKQLWCGDGKGFSGGGGGGAAE